jgi:phytoene dehydrogenase-like protein
VAATAGDTEVVVVGAGLAGLSCAVRLHEAGRRVVVLESQDGVGGRVRTDLVDGFRLDRGFQVLLTGYPAVRARFDLEALDLRAFSPGVVVRHRGRFRRLADPLQAPLAGAASAVSPVTTPADGLRLLALRRRVTVTPGPVLAAGAQTTTGAMLRHRGFSPRATASFFSPFLAGTFFDPGLMTSSRITELVFRSFFRGEVAVPMHGMQRLPDQLADRLPAGTVRLRTAVDAVAGDGVVLADGGRVVAGHVVVATDGPVAARLLGGRIDVAPGRGGTTLWYAAEASPVGGNDLVLDADGDGPVTTLAVMSDVAAAYAPAGAALVSVSSVGVPGVDDPTLDAQVRRQLRGWYGADVAGWRLLRVDRIPYAQPRQEPRDLPTLRRHVRVEPSLWVCGDHRDTGSIQGALVSGRRTAEEILEA